MNRADAARLLGLAAAYDSRTVGETDVAAWHLALDGLDPARCKAAIVKHYRESTDRIMPAHIRRLARTTTGSPGAISGTGETYCDACKGIHRATEACAVLVAPAGLRKAIRSAFRSVADALQLRALPATPAAPEAPDVTRIRPLSAVEQRCARQSTALPPDATAATCRKCEATYLDYPDGHDAHQAVFGHRPPASTDAQEAS